MTPEPKDVRDRLIADAVGYLPGRRSTAEHGADDLQTLRDVAAKVGHELDQKIACGQPDRILGVRAFYRQADPDNKHLGTNARRRIDSAHKLDEAALIFGCQPILDGQLPPPCGIQVTVWHSETKMPIGTPGVSSIRCSRPAREIRVLTQIVASLVGGERSSSYVKPMLIIPPSQAEDLDALACEAIQTAREARLRLLDLLSVEAYGSMPLLFGNIRAAQYDDEMGLYYGAPSALADSPAAIDALAELTNEDVPWLAQFAIDQTGQMRIPEDWWLDLSPLADSTSERPRTIAGPALRIRQPHHIINVLLSRRHRAPVLTRVPDVAGYAQIANGSIMARGTHGTVAIRVLSHTTPQGLQSLGLTNLPNTAAGHLRLSMAIEGLFGSPSQRVGCRKRAGAYLARMQFQTTSKLAARRISGLIVMSYDQTVTTRVRTIV
jgi:hypothetical protein